MSEPLKGDGSSGVEVQALAVASDIMEVLATKGRHSAADIARALDMTPPRVWRHLNSLEALGFVDGGSGRGFVLGSRLARLGQRALDGISLVDVAQGPLSELRDHLGELVYLAVPGEDGAVVVLSLNSGSQISLHLALGVVFKWHASASGRVIAAFSTEERRRQMLPDDSLASDGHNPITDREELEERLTLIRSRGYDVAETREAERTTGSVYINAIAAPVFDHTNGIAAAVGIMTGIPSEEALSAPAIREPLFRCVAQISAGLGSIRWEALASEVGSSEA